MDSFLYDISSFSIDLLDIDMIALSGTATSDTSTLYERHVKKRRRCLLHSEAGLLVKHRPRWGSTYFLVVQREKTAAAAAAAAAQVKNNNRRNNQPTNHPTNTHTRYIRVRELLRKMVLHNDSRGCCVGIYTIICGVLRLQYKSSSLERFEYVFRC
jgi:hypothetical protein